MENWLEERGKSVRGFFLFFFSFLFFTSKQVFKMESCGKLDYFFAKGGIISRDDSGQLEIYMKMNRYGEEG